VVAVTCAALVVIAVVLVDLGCTETHRYADGACEIRS
jgi:hypothetical protein